MHLTSYWKQKQETNDNKNTSFEKKKREKKNSEAAKCLKWFY